MIYVLEVVKIVVANVKYMYFTVHTPRQHYVFLYDRDHYPVYDGKVAAVMVLIPPL
jgi:hypothetical protein